jgi:DNA-binding SARP family transcriptional activator
MRIALLGGARVESEAGTEHIGSRQSALVLTYLVLNRRRAVLRDELADALWGEALPATWGATLRVVISRLRTMFAEHGLDGKAVLTAGPSGYSLRLPDDVRIDVEDIQGELRAAEAAFDAGRHDDALARARIAATLARAPLFPEADGDWLSFPREEIARRRLRALEVVSRAASASGRAADAVAAAEEALALDPLLESSYRLLMQAYIAASDRAAALVAYERCRASLAEELGTDPSEETQALHHAILRMPSVRPDPDPRLPAPLEPRVAGAFVGRAGELDTLCALFERAASEGRAEVAVVSGEAGIGKTRLCAQFAQAALGRGAVVVYGRCDEDALAPYQPFVEALARRVREWPPLADVVPAVVSGLLPGIGSAVRGEPQTERLRLFEGIADLLAASVAGHRGGVVVLDDLHWADRSTLLLVDYVVRARPDVPVVFVGTYRGAEPPPELRDAIAELERLRQVVRVPLYGLTQRDLEELIEDVAAGAGPYLARALAERTDGNPFFALEILRHFREGTEVLELGAAGLDAFGTPAGIRDVIHRRVATLPDDARDVLVFAAVVGREFELDVVERLRDGDVLDALETATRAGLIVDVVESPGVYRFAHHLVRQVLYEDLSALRRGRLHARTGEALEVLAGDVPESRAASLAHHFGAGAAVSGPTKAAWYSKLAGDGAMRALAFEEAAAHYERALGFAAPGEEATRAALLIALADAEGRSGRTRLAWRHLQAAFPFARDAGMLDDLGAVLVRATSSLATNWDPEAWEFAHWGLDHLPATDSAVRSIMLSRAALAAQSFGVPADVVVRAKPLSVEAHEMAERIGDATARSAAIQARILCDPSPELLPERLGLLNELVALTIKTGDEPLRMNTHLWLGMEHLARGDLAAARASMAEFDGLGVATGHPWAEWRVCVGETTWAIMRGELEAAESGLEQSLAVGTAAAVPQATLYYLGHLYLLRWEQGRFADVADILMPLAPVLPSWAAIMFVELARYDDARALLVGMAQDAFEGLAPVFPGYWLGLMQCAYACDALGEAGIAATLLDRLSPYEGRHFVQSGFGGYWGPAEHALGGLAATLGDATRARRYLQRAISMCDDIGAPRWKARAEARLARLG